MSERFGGVGRALGAGIAVGWSRGSETVRDVRRARPWGHKRFYGDAGVASGAPLGVPVGALRVRGRRAHGSGAAQPLGSYGGHSLDVHGHGEGPLGQADLGYRRGRGASRYEHGDLDGPPAQRPRKVLPRQNLGDPPASVGCALGACGAHTNRALRRIRGSRASCAGGGGPPGRGARGAGGGSTVTRASLTSLASTGPKSLTWIVVVLTTAVASGHRSGVISGSV